MNLQRFGTAALVIAVGLGLAGPVAGQAPEGSWETWQTENYRLGPGETMQFQVTFDQIPVRNWRLQVESAGNILSDLQVQRRANDSLLYAKSDESHHQVDIPWGKMEEVSVVLTAGRHGGTYVVSFLGPPRDATPAAYSYPVNRALEAYTAGQRVRAEQLCRQALQQDPSDGAAAVILAGFLQEAHYYDLADSLLQSALLGDLSPEMQELARQMTGELERVRPPLPPEVQHELATAERQLTTHDPEAALATCDRILDRREGLSGDARGQTLQLRGQALHELGRYFEAVDSFTQALTVTRSRRDQAIVYFFMGQLYMDMDNPEQAAGAFNIALKYGLPQGLELQATEIVRQIKK